MLLFPTQYMLSFRCGEIFCGKCTSYTQRLSLLAQRDPDGILYKVMISDKTEDKKIMLKFAKNYA